MDVRAKLEAAIADHTSLLCVGLDPDPRHLPVADVLEFNKAIIDATADLVCAYKPNLAFYLSLGPRGLEILLETASYIPRSIPTILDAKVNDIGNTSQAYARAYFEALGFDAVTANPYLGRDGLEPFLNNNEKMTFVLCRTSNPGAADLQDLPVGGGDALDRPLYERVATTVRSWNTAGNVGLVVGATYPEELRRVRELCPDMAILLPGVGTQGGDLEAAVRGGVDRQGSGLVINIGRAIIFAASDGDFAGAARKQAAVWRDRINTLRGTR